MPAAPVHLIEIVMTSDDESSQSAPATAVDQPSVDGEIRALNDVIAAFKGLTPDGRARLLKTVATFFGIAQQSDHVHHSSTVGASQDSVRSGSVSSFSEDRTPSPKEFILDKRPLQDVERVTCLAYYLTHYRDTPHFKTVDLSKLNTEAAQVKLSNPAQAVDNATKAGMLLQAANGNKQISAMGELYVQSLPDRQAAKEAIAHFRQRRRSRKPRAGGSAPRPTSDDDKA